MVLFQNSLIVLKQSATVQRTMGNPLQLHLTVKVTFGSQSLLSLGPQIWNALPIEKKLAENIQTFFYLFNIKIYKTRYLRLLDYKLLDNITRTITREARTHDYPKGH